MIAWFAVAVAIIALVINAVAVRGSGSGTVAAAATTPTIEVTLKEFSITPSSLTAAPGPLKITVTNAGTMVHNFSITGLKATRDLNPGESQTLELDVKAGHYDIQCTIPGHAGSGMKAMLMVAEGATASSADSAAADSSGSTMSWQDMDKAMSDVAKSFPAATKGHGGEPLPPTVLADGTKEFDLTAQVVDWEVAPGKIVKAWTYNGVVPAPEIRVAVGDKVKVVLKNELPESTALHFHGVRVPNSMDGVDPYTQPAIEPGQTFTYEFTTLEPAVGMYHSHHDAVRQVPDGLAGAFLVGSLPMPAGVTVSQD
jgi:plastocyanin